MTRKALVHYARTAETLIVACGVRVKLRSNNSLYLKRMRDLLPEIWKPSSAKNADRVFSLQVGTSGLRPRGVSNHRLFEGEERIFEAWDLNLVLGAFERRIKMYLAEMARGKVFVHAGAVGWQGKAILIPGRSFSGKTTLVAELVRLGAIYYSDEYALLDGNGRVHPYPTPLSVRDSLTLEQKPRLAEEYGGVSGGKPLPVGLVVVSSYQPGARWQPRRITAGEAALALLDNTIPARRIPETVLSTLRQAVSQSTALEGPRGDATKTAHSILNSLSVF